MTGSSPLTPEQREISNDFMKYWHKLLPRHFSIVERFNHGYPVWHAPARFTMQGPCSLCRFDVALQPGDPLADQPAVDFQLTFPGAA